MILRVGLNPFWWKVGLEFRNHQSWNFLSGLICAISSLLTLLTFDRMEPCPSSRWQMTPPSYIVLPKSSRMIMCHPMAVRDRSWLLTAIHHVLCLCFCWDFSLLMLSMPQSSSPPAALTWIWSSWLYFQLFFLCLVLSPASRPSLGHIPLKTHTFVNSWSGLKYSMINLVFFDDFLPASAVSQTSETFVCCCLILKYSQEY